MAYLYQLIKKVPGLTGNDYNRQKQLYEKLGSPMGAYKGTYSQNIWLIDQINKGNYGQSKPVTSQPTIDNREKILEAYTDKIKVDDNVFSEDIMSQEEFEKPFDEWVKGVVENYIRPEFQRYQYDPYMKAASNQLYDLNQNIGLSGAWRTGAAKNDLNAAAQQAILGEEQLLRDYNDQVLQIRDQFKSNWSDPLYRSRMEEYYNAPFRDVNVGEVSPITTPTLPELQNFNPNQLVSPQGFSSYAGIQPQGTTLFKQYFN